MENASATVKDVTATIIAQRMELENKNKTITMLQKALNEQKELTLYHAKEMEKEEQRRLTLLKSEHEETVKRHQCFIDQVISKNYFVYGLIYHSTCVHLLILLYINGASL